VFVIRNALIGLVIGQEKIQESSPRGKDTDFAHTIGCAELEK